MKYDDASWHYGGDFPAGLPPSAGATHIALFAAWAALSGLGSDRLAVETKVELDRLASRALTPGQWFARVCDEVFADGELNAEGNAFTSHYYPGLYTEDYNTRVFPRIGLYAVEDSWASYDTLRPTLDRRFSAWRKDRKRSAKTPRRRR